MPQYKVIRMQDRSTLGMVTAPSQAEAQKAAEKEHPNDGYLELSLLPPGTGTGGACGEDALGSTLALLHALLIEWRKAAEKNSKYCEITLTMPAPYFDEDPVLTTHTWRGDGDHRVTETQCPSGNDLSMEIGHHALERLVHRWAVNECKFTRDCRVSFYDLDNMDSGSIPVTAMVTMPGYHPPTERPPAVTSTDHETPALRGLSEEDPED